MAIPDMPDSDRISREVGILCVHGIGFQKRGDTLSQFVDPIVRDLRRAANNNGWDNVVRADPGSKGGSGTPPAVCVIDLGRTDPTTKHLIVTRCTFAESHWAEVFNPAKIDELAPWLLTRGAWILIRYLSTLTLVPKLPRASRVFGVMLGLPAALIFQLFVLIFWVAGKIPIPQLRPYINSSLLLLTGSVGDSLALDSPTRRAQIESKIIPSAIDQNPCAHWRNPMDMIRQG